MYNDLWQIAPTTSLPDDLVRRFCDTYLFHDGKVLSLADTRDQTLMADLAGQAAIIFSEYISIARKHLDDLDTGIVAIDIPSVFKDATLDAITGSLIAVTISQVIMPSSLDRENQTPFSIFTASKDNSKKLDNIGIQGMSPTDILDFHSDGSIKGDILSVPDYISIYNIFINYSKTGSFYWVPTSKLRNLNYFTEKLGMNTDYCFSLTPTVYDSGLTDVKIINRRAKASLFSETHRGSITTFMNGIFEGRDSDEDAQYIDLINEFKSAITNNEFRLFVPQESRKLVILNNSNGFHARDIFEDPIEGYAVTRTYLRSTSISGQVVGRIIEG